MKVQLCEVVRRDSRQHVHHGLAHVPGSAENVMADNKHARLRKLHIVSLSDAFRKDIELRRVELR